MPTCTPSCRAVAWHPAFLVTPTRTTSPHSLLLCTVGPWVCDCGSRTPDLGCCCRQSRLLGRPPRHRGHGWDWGPRTQDIGCCFPRVASPPRPAAAMAGAVAAAGAVSAATMVAMAAASSGSGRHGSAMGSNNSSNFGSNCGDGEGDEPHGVACHEAFMLLHHVMLHSWFYTISPHTDCAAHARQGTGLQS